LSTGATTVGDDAGCTWTGTGNSFVATFGGGVATGDGTAVAPSVMVGSAGGMYAFSGNLGFAVGSTRRMYITSTYVSSEVSINFGGFNSYASSVAHGVVSFGTTATSGDGTGTLRATYFVPPSAGGGDVGTSTYPFRKAYVDYTNTATVGAVTINKASGRVILATGASSVVVTDSLVTAASHIFVTRRTNDATALFSYLTSTAGSFTIFATAAATGDTEFDFFVVSAD